MPVHSLRRQIPKLLVCLYSLLPCITVAEEYSAEQISFFESKIRPVLIKECYGCHSNKAGNVRGGLLLDTQTLTHLGGSSGPAVVPGNLEESLLYNAIMHEDFVMPPKRKLPPKVIEDFREWIEMGAPDPRESSVQAINPTVTTQDIERAKESFWAFQPPKDNAPPTVEDTAWPKTDIDRFILAKLEESDLTPPADTEPHKLLRRLCFDLIGLPPTPEQIEYFDEKWNTDPDRAVDFVVERLLGTEYFGERWGRHWLDVARYAESTGRGVNFTFPHAWRYRDFVIDSFNSDKPFNQFVQQQIAGDLLPADSDEQWAENLIATTFLAIGPKNLNEQNRVQFAADQIDEQIDATTRAFLGISVSCARCHDHKFDPIPQTDYYAMAGLFSNLTTYFGNPPSEYGSFATPQTKRQSSLIRLPIDDPSSFDASYSPSELASLKSEMEALMDESREMRRDRSSKNAQRNRIVMAGKLSAISAKLAVVDQNGNPRSFCMGVQERTSPKDAPVLIRGEIDQRGSVVPRGFPQVLCSTPYEISNSDSGRLELARWIGSSDNTLTARVMANRVWQHLLGQGIVTSTENFGVTGQFPSHPELLDYLAVNFVRSNWSIKSLIRSIVTSRVYRMNSAFNVDYHELDPSNALLWRANPRRLDAEALRDAMLSISGALELERPRGSLVAETGYMRVRNGVLGDPRKLASAALNEVRATMRETYRPGRDGRSNLRSRASRSRVTEQVAEQGRAAFAQAARGIARQLDMEAAKFRSVYLPIVRDSVPRSLDVFDFADPNSITGQRESSNSPNQALYMLNNPFVLQQAENFADRISQRSQRDLKSQIDHAFQLSYGRAPTTPERRAATQFLRSFSATTNAGVRQFSSQATDRDTLVAFCQSLFASAEFRFID